MFFRQTTSQQQINIKPSQQEDSQQSTATPINNNPKHIVTIPPLTLYEQSLPDFDTVQLFVDTKDGGVLGDEYLGLGRVVSVEEKDNNLLRKRVFYNDKDNNSNYRQQSQLLYDGSTSMKFVQESLMMQNNLQQQQHHHIDLNSQIFNNNKINNNKNNHHEYEYEYYLLYMVNDNLPLDQEEEITHEVYNKRISGNSSSNKPNTINKSKVSLKTTITLLISLCDKVIVYQLDKQKQSFIEKVFVQSVNTCQKIKWETKMHVNRPNRLVFVRQCYGDRKQTHSKKLQGYNNKRNYHQGGDKDKRSDKEKQHDNKSKDKDRNKSKQKQTEKQRQFKTKSSTLTAATSLQTLQYYSSLQEYSEYLQIQRKKYLNLCSIYPQRPDHPYVQEIIKKNNCIKLISLQQILSIYSQAVKFITGNDEKSPKGNRININEMFSKTNPYNEMMEKVDSLDQPWKVRYYLQKVYQLESITNLYNAIEYEIFHPHVSSKHSHEFIHKQIKKYLTAHNNPTNLIFSQHSLSHLQYIPPFSRHVTLSSQSKQKLLWKLNRLEKYQRQLQQEYKISPQMSQDKILYQLRDQEIFNWIAKYKNRWLEISMTHLKGYFNKIANQKDHKAIQQFKQQCYKMTQKLNKIDIKLYDQPRQDMIKQIIKEINTFVDYHFEVLETRRLAGIKYLYHEIQYTLRHKQKVRNKLMLFALMVILALMQKNVIAGITIATMAIIVLAIRI